MSRGDVLQSYRVGPGSRPQMLASYSPNFLHDFVMKGFDVRPISYYCVINIRWGQSRKNHP